MSSSGGRHVGNPCGAWHREQCWEGGGGVGVRVEGAQICRGGLMIYLDPGGTCASQTLMAPVTLPTRTVLGFRQE